MKAIRYIPLLFVISFYIGCGGDEVEAPIPTISQNEEETEIFAEKNSSNEIETNTTDTNISSETIDIGEANISIVDEDNSTIEEEKKDTPVLIDEDIDYINTQFESIYFDFDRYSIKEEMLPIIEKNIQLLNSPQVSGKEVVIEGNCDEWGTDEYNYALGLKRAQVVKEALIADGVKEDRIRVISYGESNPVCLEQQDECWAKNRRVDFKLVK